MTEPDPASQHNRIDDLLDRDMTALARRNPGRFWLALAIIFALVLMTLSAWRQGWFTPTSHLFVVLPGAVGVQVGTQVKLKGFKIGEVDSLELEPTLNVRVRLRVVQDRLNLLGKDASAKFGRDGPLGGKFIDILPGAREGKRLEEETTLPMDTGNELEDVMGTVKVAIEKLATVIGKVEPILDDTKKLTGEASAMRQDLRSSVTTVLGNMQDMSVQLKRVGDSASRVAGKLDADRAAIIVDVKKVLSQAEQAAASARATVQLLEQGMPTTVEAAKGATENFKGASENIKGASENVKTSTADVKQIIQEAKQDIAPAVRSARSVTQDAAEITDGLKRTWPVSSFVKPAPDGSLPLDSFEGPRK